jgi:arylsulfatase
MSNTPFRRHKTWVHEGGTCTPFIAHWPKGIRAHGELRQTVGHVIDFVPTILDLAGITVDKTGSVPYPGQSLKNSFTSDMEHQKPLWYYHEGNRALRTGNWKIVAAKDEPWELFDLSTDRTESDNLAGSNPEKVAELENQWNKMLEDFRRVTPQKTEETQKVTVTTTKPE